MTTPARSRRKTAAFYAVFMLLLFGIGELSFALLMRVSPLLPPSLNAVQEEYYYAAEQHIIQMMPECARYDASLSYTLRPGECRFSGREFDIQVAVNSLGVRDDEASLRAPAVVVAGDSMAMGWGVDKRQTFADLIEQRSGAPVLNTGVSSYGTSRELDILRRVDLSNLRLLILQYSENDLTENATFVRNGHVLPVMSEAEYRERQDQHRADIRYFFGKHMFWLTGRVLRGVRGVAARTLGPRPAATDPDEAHLFYDILVSKLRDMAALSTPGHPPVALVLFGLHWDDRTGQAALAAAGGWPPGIHHVLRVDYPADASAYFALDGHMNPQGHADVAGRILQASAGVQLH